MLPGHKIVLSTYIRYPALLSIRKDTINPPICHRPLFIDHIKREEDWGEPLVHLHQPLQQPPPPGLRGGRRAGGGVAAAQAERGFPQVLLQSPPPPPLVRAHGRGAQNVDADARDVRAQRVVVAARAWGQARNGYDY